MHAGEKILKSAATALTTNKKLSEQGEGGGGGVGRRCVDKAERSGKGVWVGGWEWEGDEYTEGGGDTGRVEFWVGCEGVGCVVTVSEGARFTDQ